MTSHIVIFILSSTWKCTYEVEAAYNLEHDTETKAAVRSQIKSTLIILKPHVVRKSQFFPTLLLEIDGLIVWMSERKTHTHKKQQKAKNTLKNI